MLLFVGVTLVGCSEPPSAKTPHAVANFEPDNPIANASVLANLVGQLCIDNGDDRDRFANAITATGWRFERTQTLDPNNPYSVDVWNAPEAQVIHGKLSGDEILVCNVAVADGVAARDQLSRALSGLAQGPRKGGEWRWRQGAHEFVMDFADGAEPATQFQVNVEIWRLPWWRRLLG